MPDKPDNSSSSTKGTSRLKAVVFDLDGLMFNTEELYQHVGGEVLRRRGKLFDAELLDAMMGRPGSVALQLMIDWHQLVDTVEQLATESDEVFAGILGERLETMPGLLQLLDALERAAVPKAIATSSRRAFVTDVLSRFDLPRRGGSRSRPTAAPCLRPWPSRHPRRPSARRMRSSARSARWLAFDAS